MRYFLFLICTAILLVNAGCFSAGNLIPAGDETLETVPPSANSAAGVSLLVNSVERGDDLIRLNLYAVNGNDNAIDLASTNDALVLRDNLGNEYPAKEEKIELQPLTVNNISVEFLGAPKSGAETFSLTTNTKYSNDSRKPRLVVENIPVPGGGKVSFKTDETAAKPQTVELQNKTVNHPNGTSFTAQNITFGADTIDIRFQAVNGNKYENDFSTRNNQTFLQDEKSNRYFMIPPSTGSKIEVPPSQKLSGTLRFAGKIPPDVKNLTLHINDGAGGDNEYARSPKIVVGEIPTGR